MSETKKQSLVELGLSLGFRAADENDPIYQEGWIIASTVGQALERFSKLEEGQLETDE
jgi:hypothetical protein